MPNCPKCGQAPVTSGQQNTFSNVPMVKLIDAVGNRWKCRNCGHKFKEKGA